MEQAPRAVRLRIDLAYDGSGFSGWAAQPGRRTVEDVLATALGRVLRLGSVAPPALTVAGRTDAGVHARGQVVHADVPEVAWTALADHGAGPLVRLAAVLPADVRVHAAGPAPDGFDARFSALWRRYSYRVCDDPARADPLRRHETLWWPRRLDLAAMTEAAASLATFLGRSFSVVTTLSRTTGHTRELLRGYGFTAACAGVHACGIPVLDLDSPSAWASVGQACVAARDADGCDVIVLGCAGMTGLAASLSGTKPETTTAF